MSNKKQTASDLREAKEQLREEFAREIILYNPNPGITIDKLIAKTDKFINEKNN